MLKSKAIKSRKCGASAIDIKEQIGENTGIRTTLVVLKVMHATAAGLQHLLTLWVVKASLYVRKQLFIVVTRPCEEFATGKAANKDEVRPWVQAWGVEPRPTMR